MIINCQKVFQMTKKNQREIERKLRVLHYAERIGQMAKARRYLGIGRASFCRWKRAYKQGEEEGLVNANPFQNHRPIKHHPRSKSKSLISDVNIPLQARTHYVVYGSL